MKEWVKKEKHVTIESLLLNMFMRSHQRSMDSEWIYQFSHLKNVKPTGITFMENWRSEVGAQSLPRKKQGQRFKHQLVVMDFYVKCLGRRWQLVGKISEKLN